MTFRAAKFWRRFGKVPRAPQLIYKHKNRRANNLFESKVKKITKLYFSNFLTLCLKIKVNWLWHSHDQKVILQMTQVLGRQRNKQNRKRIQAFWTSFLKSNKLLDYHCFILSRAALILTIFSIILITLVHTIFISLPMRTRIVEDLFEDSSSNVFYKTKKSHF